MINELNNKGSFEDIKIYMKINKSLCNDVLYKDSKYKESTIILTHIFNNIMTNFCKEVYDCVNKEGAYKH